MAKFKEGDRVRHIPDSAKGDPRHESTRTGEVDYVDEHNDIYVKFDNDVCRRGWQNAPSVQIAEKQLRHEKKKVSAA